MNQALANMMRKKGVTQTDFASACKVGQPAVSKWLNSKRGIPSWARDRLMTAFPWTVGYLPRCK